MPRLAWARRKESIAKRPTMSMRSRGGGKLSLMRLSLGIVERKREQLPTSLPEGGNTKRKEGKIAVISIHFEEKERGERDLLHHPGKDMSTAPPYENVPCMRGKKKQQLTILWRGMKLGLQRMTTAGLFPSRGGSSAKRTEPPGRGQGRGGETFVRIRERGEKGGTSVIREERRKKKRGKQRPNCYRGGKVRQSKKG